MVDGVTFVTESLTLMAGIDLWGSIVHTLMGIEERHMNWDMLYKLNLVVCWASWQPLQRLGSASGFIFVVDVCLASKANAIHYALCSWQHLERMINAFGASCWEEIRNSCQFIKFASSQVQTCPYLGHMQGRNTDTTP